jgi:hypothetical protein
MTRGLRYYAIPQDVHLKPHISISCENDSTSNRQGRGKGGLPFDDNSLIKKTSVVPLNVHPLTPSIVMLMYYYTELKWILDLLIAVVLLVFITLIAYCIQPDLYSSQVNLSSAWVAFILINVLLSLYSMTSIYYTQELAKERIIQVVFSLLLFVMALSTLLLEDILDFNLRDGHKSFIIAISNTINHTIEIDAIQRYIPYWSYIGVLAIISTSIGSLLIFPSLNYSQLHFETIRHNKGYFVRVLLHINYILPLISLSMWFQPLASENVPPSLSNALYRNICLFSLCVIRFVLYKHHMETYLNRANYGLSSLRAIKAKVTVGDFKMKIKSILSFYCGAGMQYIGPVVVLMSFHLLSIISSGYAGMFTTSGSHDSCTLFWLSVYSSPISFLCWWICLVMFFMSSIASLAYTYLT